MLKAKVKKFSEDDVKDSIGLVDGGHTYLECSSCGNKLIDIFHTQPDAIDPRTGEPFQWKMRAQCCYCGDKSYIKDITGKFHIGGYGEDKEDDPNDDIPRTKMNGDYTEIIDGEEVLVIKTVKA